MTSYLIFRTDRIGDFLISAILIKCIKINDPKSHITVIASKKNYLYIRDFTYIDDIVNGIIGAINKQVLSGQTETYNLGNSRPISLNDLIDLISEVSGKKAKLEKHPMQDGDVIATYSKIENAIGNLNYLPKTRLIDGLTQFYKWFLEPKNNK